MKFKTIIEQIILIEKKKLQNKGLLNTSLGLTLLFLIFSIAHAIGQTIWPAQISSPSNFIFTWSVIIHSSVQFIYFLLYLPGYLGISKFYEGFKINKNSFWPWKKQNWSQIKGKVIKNIIINQFITYPILIFLTSKISKMRVQGFPSLIQLMLQILFIELIEDFFFFLTHRLFHIYPSLYRFHKVHHENQQLYSLVAEYFHPVDFVLGNIVPSSLGVVLLGSHVHSFTVFFWIAFKLYIGIERHSGYQFPWSPLQALPFVCGSSYHDFHHSNNVGNFQAGGYVWDLVFQTNEVFLKQFLKQQKVK